MRIALAAALVAVLALAGGAQGARSGLAPKPDVGPVLANFVPIETTTYYAVEVTEPPARKGGKVSIVWSLAPPPNDKACKSFASPAGKPNIAIWQHGDRDGCNRNAIGDRGYPGTVTVTVRDAAYVCTGSYFGTMSGSGAYPVCLTVQRVDATRDLGQARVLLARGNLRGAAALLTKAAAELSTLDVPAAATAAAHVRNAVAFAKAGARAKALAEARKTEALLAKLP